MNDPQTNLLSIINPFLDEPGGPKRNQEYTDIDSILIHNF